MDAGRQSGWQRGKISALNYCFTRAVRGFQHLEDGRCFLLSLHVSDPKGSKHGKKGKESSFNVSLTSIFSPNGASVRLALMNASGLVAWSVCGGSWTWTAIGSSEIDAHIRISTYNKSRRDYKTRVLVWGAILQVISRPLRCLAPQSRVGFSGARLSLKVSEFTPQ